MNHDTTVTRSSMPPLKEYIDKIQSLWDSRWLTNMEAYHRDEEKEFLIIYKEKLSHIEGIILPGYDKKAIQYSYGYFPVLFQPEILGRGMRDVIYHELRNIHIQARKYFYPITSDAPCFRNKYRKVPLENARYAGNNILVLPLYSELEFEKMDEIISVIEKICGQKCN